MFCKSICIISIIVLSANVNYAQVITINAFGKTVKRAKSLRDEALNVLPGIDSTTSERVEVKKNEREPDLVLPLSFLTVTSTFGKRVHPIYHYKKQHAGIDLRASYEVVYAFAGGIVNQAAYNSKSGNYITILHGTSKRLTSTYAHLSYINVKPGDTVEAGQIIGISGNTGLSTSPHLHFSLKVDNIPIDPFPVLRFLVQLKGIYPFYPVESLCIEPILYR